MQAFDEILNYKKPKSNYYTVLGCSQSSSIEQINTEYKVRALKLHPDKNAGDPECLEQFKTLQKAKDVLTNEQKRKDYDLWLNSGLAIDFDRWTSYNKTHSMHWATPKSSKLMIDVMDSSHDAVRSQSSRVNNSCRPDVKYTTMMKNEDQGDVLRKFRNYEI